MFDPAAEKYNDRIAGEYGLSKYYFGTKCQTVTRSKYSGKTLTRTQEIRSNNMLGVGIDQVQRPEQCCEPGFNWFDQNQELQK